jgi:chemosensory pili system protein ChpA (sensor histidine kinase/response regulator)
MSKTIIIADDSESIRTVLKLTLEFKGYRVIETTNGREAWEQLQSQGCDLLITDLAMPEMSGLELLHKIRNEASNADLPVIVCTAEALGNEAKYLEQGANDLLNKPISPTELLELITRHLK